MTEDERFRRAVEIVLAHEGGYVNDPADPGGETKYGISKRSYPSLDIRNLTRDQAIAIYRRDWWDRLRLGEIQDPDLAAKVLDLAVNVGAVTGIMLLQRALTAAGHRVTVDGVMGPATLAAANAADPRVILAALRSEAAGHYRVLIARNAGLKRFEQGWLKRAYA
ncbi:MAG: glycoside hydrolase family 108 protein [Betaproteobacteria bacterium]